MSSAVRKFQFSVFYKINIITVSHQCKKLSVQFTRSQSHTILHMTETQTRSDMISVTKKMQQQMDPGMKTGALSARLLRSQQFFRWTQTIKLFP